VRDDHRVVVAGRDPRHRPLPVPGREMLPSGDEQARLGTYQPTLDTYIDGMAAYGWNKNDTTRHNVGGVGGLTAHGSYNANQVTAQIEAGHNYTVDDTILTPNVLAHTVWYDPDCYTETGAGGAGLHVDGNSQSLFESGGGAEGGLGSQISGRRRAQAAAPRRLPLRAGRRPDRGYFGFHRRRRDLHQWIVDFGVN